MVQIVKVQKICSEQAIKENQCKLRRVPKISPTTQSKKRWLKICVSKYANYDGIKELMDNISKIRQLHTHYSGSFKIDIEKYANNAVEKKSGSNCQRKEISL